MPTALIVPPTLYEMQGDYLKVLRDAGFSVRFTHRGDTNPNEAELCRYLTDVDAVLAGGELYSETVLQSAPKLRVMSRIGVGYDCVDLDACRRRGIVVAITPGANDQAVAEHTLALLLAVGRRLLQRHRAVVAGRWPRDPLPAIRGSTLGLIGLGRIGRAVALRARPFDMHILAYEPLPDMKFVAEYGIRLVPLDELLRESDFVSLHVPLLPETEGIINRRTLALMKPTAVLVNTARGGLVNEDDLYDALSSGQIAAAGLDVFVREPCFGTRLLELDNVLATPHMAGVDHRSVRDMLTMAAQNVVDLHQGRWLPDRLVNPDLGPGWKW